MSRFRILVEELRRRHVFRVAAAYAVVGWVVVEVSSTVAPLLLLPEWVPRAIVVLVILGFPVAVVLAWAYDITPDGVEPTGAEAPVAPEAPRRGPVAPAAGVAAALLVLAAAGVVGWILVRGGSDSGDPALQGDALLARVDSLVDQRRFTEAFGLVSRAEVGGETVPSTVRARVSDRLTVLTDPPEATVSARRFDDAESNGTPTESWDELGTTPLRGLDLARGDYFVRMEREGSAAVERLVSSSDARAGPPPNQVPEVLLRVPMFPVDSIPEQMVFVPGGAYSVVSRNVQGLLANVDDYFLDRFEVTNDDFAEFVREGGYRDREHWTALLGDPTAPEADEALRGFVDRTGLPGPRQWQGQSVPDGRGEHPVTGVTWYEAAAYCRYRGGRLPTLFEWEKAARDGQVSSFGVRMPWGTLTSAPGGRTRANFNGEGTSPVGAHPFGLSPYGAYDMAGNVKEWLLNPTETGRAVTGGSWEDPIYLFTEVGGMEPLSVSDALGFRCARGREKGSESPSGAGATELRVAPETPEYDPVGDAAFAGLLSHYAYDRRPVDAELTERAEGPGWVRERLVYDGPDDSRVIAYLYLPTGTEPPYQTLAFVPGSDVFYGVGVPDAAEWLLAPVIRSGRALFAVVMDGMT
ncbi:MAG: formylglycine-generating enzyme family protein, partial [Longimicrobiales bacterium]